MSKIQKWLVYGIINNREVVLSVQDSFGAAIERCELFETTHAQLRPYVGPQN